MAGEKSRMPLRSKVLLWLLTPCVVVAAAGGWLGATTSGLQWLVTVAERRSGGSFSAAGIGGSLFDAPVVGQLVLKGDGWRITVKGLQMHWRPAALLHKQLNVMDLSAQQIDVLSLPSDHPTVLPTSLMLPLEVSMLQMNIGSLRMFSKEAAPADFEASDIKASFASDAQHYNLKMLQIKLPYGEFAANGQMATQSPFALKATATLDTPLTLSGRSEMLHVAANADGDLQHLALQLSGKGAGMNARGNAQLAPVADVWLSGIQIHFDGVEAHWIADVVPSARLSGNTEWHGIKGGGMEGTLQLHNAHPLAFDQHGMPLQGLSGRVRWADAQWQVRQMDASLPNDGHITGAMVWHTLSGKGDAHLQVHEVDPSLLHSRLPHTRLNGTIVLGSAGNNQTAKVSFIGGDVEMSGEFQHQGKQIEIRDLRVARGETVLSGHGKMAMDRRRTFQMFSKLQKLNLAEFSNTPHTDLNADMEVSGTLLPEPAGMMQFELADSRFAEYEIGGNGHFDFTGLDYVVGQAEARLGDNRLDLSVARGTGADHLRLHLIAPNLAQISKDLGGQLTGQGDLSGSLKVPELNFSLGGKQLAISGQHIDQLDAAGTLSEQTMNMQISMNGYRNAGELNVPQASIEFKGSRAQHTLTASARLAQGADALGEVSLSANGGFGDLAQGWNALQWQGSLAKLDASGILPLSLLAAAPLKLSRETMQLSAADFTLGGGKVQLNELQWTPQHWHSDGKFSGLNVRAVNMLSDKPLTDAVETMRFGGSWDVTQDEHWHGNLQVQRESGDWVIDNSTGLRLGLHSLQIALRAENDRLDARLDASGDRLGEIAAQASVPLTKKESGWSMLLEAPLAGHLHLSSDDLSWLGSMLDANLQSGGKLKLDADVVGTVQSPRLNGEAHGEDLLLALLDQGVRLQQGQLAMRFAPDAVTLDKLSFSAPYPPMPRDTLLGDYKLVGTAGQLSASGSIDLQGGKGDLQIIAERLPLAQRPDRWLIASGTGGASYANDVLTLKGNIRADAGLINQLLSNRPSWSDDVQIVGKEPAKGSGLSYAIEATLDLGEHFYIRASGLEARLDGKIDLRGNPGEALRATGTIVAQDAMFDAFGQQLQVERGMVNFQGPLDDPGLNILALRTGLIVEAGVEVTGTVRHPIVQLVSTPVVTDAEKLSWIVLGRAPDSSGFDSSLLLATAGNVLGGQSGGMIGHAIGVDDLSLHQKVSGGVMGDQGVMGNQVVTVGKRLSTRAYLSYEQGLTDASKVAKFTYTLTPRVTIVTQTGTEDSLDLVYSFRFY